MGDKNHWYQPVRFGTLRLFRGKKILGPGIVNHSKFVLDDEGYAFSFGNMYAISTNNTDIELKVLLGILNSKLVEFYLHKVAPVKQGGYYGALDCSARAETHGERDRGHVFLHRVRAFLRQSRNGTGNGFYRRCSLAENGGIYLPIFRQGLNDHN